MGYFITNIDFYKRLVAGEFKSRSGAFQSQWRESISQLDAQSTNSFALFFFYVARACGRSGENFFTSTLDHKNARNGVLNGINKVLENANILGYDFNSTQLSQIISAYYMLRMFPQGRFKYKLIQGTQSVLPNVDAQSCYNFINNFARLAVYPGDDWIEAWWQRTIECLDKMRGNWIDDIVYRLAILDYLRSQDKRYRNIESPCREVANGLLEIYRDKKDEFYPDKRMPKQITDAAIWFDFDLQMQKFTSEHESSSSSHDEKRFRQAFQAAGANLSVFYETSLDHQFDISLQFNCKSFAIEIDGSPHMLTGHADGKLYYDGATRFQTALIMKELPTNLKLVRIPTVYLNNKGFRIQEIARYVLDRSERINGKPVIMHGNNKFVPVTDPTCWQLSA